ncbi:hypothetical protein [Nonomuraea sp. 3-1Str]|uniref:hypothetical protein n=1 Tax=unclassified Nonomuraea TaxID=2593643 RepID=UPI00285C54B5|nr:hypothetical protein [Nonomuraea sp. 3-1Str]MDR8407863.1 hypothetical protein [Nonomuraea sp. 3-1Str]
MIRKFAGAVAATLAFLAGLWLMLAPFALGTQPSGDDWTDATTTEFFTGLGVAVVGLAGAALFASAIRETLVERGLVTVRQRPEPEPQPEPEPVPAPPVASGVPQPSSAELAALLAPLVEALRADLNADLATTERPITERPAPRLDPRQAGDQHPNLFTPGHTGRHEPEPTHPNGFVGAEDHR